MSWVSVQDERLADLGDRLLGGIMVLGALTPGYPVLYCSSSYAARFHCHDTANMRGRKVFEVGPGHGNCYASSLLCSPSACLSNTE